MIPNLNIERFFSEMNREIHDNKSLLESLVNFSLAIGRMSAEELVALFQALTMIKRSQPIFIGFLKRNPVRIKISDTQMIVIRAMEHLCKKTTFPDRALMKWFNSVISNGNMGLSGNIIE